MLLWYYKVFLWEKIYETLGWPGAPDRGKWRAPSGSGCDRHDHRRAAGKQKCKNGKGMPDKRGDKGDPV